MNHLLGCILMIKVTTFCWEARIAHPSSSDCTLDVAANFHTVCRLRKRRAEGVHLFFLLIFEGYYYSVRGTVLLIIFHIYSPCDHFQVVTTTHFHTVRLMFKAISFRPFLIWWDFVSRLVLWADHSCGRTFKNLRHVQRFPIFGGLCPVRKYVDYSGTTLGNPRCCHSAQALRGGSLWS